MKKNVKIIVVLLTIPLFLFGFSNCGGAQGGTPSKKAFIQNPPFTITEAYYQDWVAGVAEGGSGTNVYIIFGEKEPNVVIQNIYYKKQILEAKGNINEPNKVVGYLKNDTANNVIMDSDPIKEAQNTPQELFPFQLESNQAVIEYWFGGKTHFYKIENLSKKQTIPYPQANPNSHE